MASPPPIPCTWTGAAFMPINRQHNLANAHYGVGEVVLLAPVEERSHASHAHEFAWLKEAWLSLPENLADEFPTPEHLRKRALIMAGFHDETVIDAGTNAAALRVASHLRKKDEFAAVVVRGPIVVERVAKSQSRRMMKKAEFQASKTAIMEVVAQMLGVEPETLARAA